MPNSNSCFVDGVVHDIDYARVRLADGTVHDIDEGRVIGPDGQMHYIAFGPTPLWRQPVGTRVYTNVLGVKREFIVIQKGKPDSPLYDETSDGIWLLQNSVYESSGSGPGAYHAVLTTYGDTEGPPKPGHGEGWNWSHFVRDNSEDNLDPYRGNNFMSRYLASLDPGIRAGLLTPKLPYAYVEWSANGLTSEALSPLIALSAPEAGFQYYSDPINQGKPNESWPVAEDGVTLEYFKPAGNDNVKRQARSVQRPGSNVYWYLRSAYYRVYLDPFVGYERGLNTYACSGPSGKIGQGNKLDIHNEHDTFAHVNYRPCMIVAKNTMIDKDNNLIAY